MAALLGGLNETFGEGSFTAQDVAKIADGFETANETDGTWTASVRAVLEEATGKTFPKGNLSAIQVGKRLQMVVGRPTQVGNRVLTLERTPDPKRGNTYKIKSR